MPPGDPRVRDFLPSELLNSRKTGIDAFYCRPGIGGAHEKGGVEGQIGWFRRNRLVPVPEVPSIQAGAQRDDRPVGHR